MRMNGGWLRTVAVLAAMPLCAGVAHGAIGDLDPAFGGGVIISQLGQGATPLSEPLDVKVQPDGKIVAGGAASDSLGNIALALARYLPSGSLDPSFGGAGTGAVVTQFGSGGSPMSAAYFGGLVILGDGHIVACGVATDSSGHNNALVARFTSGGVLDASFGSGGRTLLQLGTNATPASNLFGCSVQPDGKIIGVGAGNDVAGNQDLAVVRLTPSGSPDPTFGSGGVFLQQLGLGASPTSTGVDSLVLADGHIAVSLVVSDASGNGSMGVARLTTSGMLDASFGTGGFTFTTFPGTPPRSEGIHVALQPSGKLIVSGDATDSMSHQAYGVARYSSGGAPDPSFGIGGLVVTQPSNAATPSSLPYGLVVQPNGKIVLVGGAQNSSGGELLTLARYTPDGTLDPTFGGTAIVQKQFGIGATPVTIGTAAAFSPTGKLYTVGAVMSSSTSWFVASFIADQPPTAAFTFSPNAPVVGDTITFDASSSHDAEGSIAQVAWDLNGDGNFGDATGMTTSSSFATGGVHHVAVLVSDDDGIQASAAADIPVGCGTAQTFLSVDCRLTALIAQVDGGVTGPVHDHLNSALASVQSLEQQAAGQSGKTRKKTVGKALRGLGKFTAGVGKGRKSISKTLRAQLLATAKDLRSALKALR